MVITSVILYSCSTILWANFVFDFRFCYVLNCLIGVLLIVLLSWLIIELVNFIYVGYWSIFLRVLGFVEFKCDDLIWCSKTSLRLAGSRLKLLRNKKEVQVKQMKREIAPLLESGQDRTARIRVLIYGSFFWTRSVFYEIPCVLFPFFFVSSDC